MNTFNPNFKQLKSGQGTLDIAIRFDSVTGAYELILEENGLPTETPVNAIVGALESVKVALTVAAYFPQD